ncbi:6-phospho-beta-glucosidase [Dactylosporangium sp. McL0621]|uniref:family 4 glycosyl hydrolase n=1 Tax=Dactylosporangium sp. McL0621 TaxID=3415678 RepID=UPI003CFB8329
MRLTILGGGGFRVPLIHRALLRDPLAGHVVLHDTDPGRLAAIERVLAAQARGAAAAPRVTATTDLTAALTGADVVFSAIRVHGLAGRVLDERIAIAEGVLGQETVGAGGLSFGLRTVPVATGIARRIAAVAPRAWVVNFTNPAGLVTEAMAAHLGDRVIGICDSPAGLCRRFAPGDPAPDYAGLNHLGWLRAAGRSIPNEYLHYYEDPPGPARGPTRGEFLQEQQSQLYRRLADPHADPLSAWDGVRAERDATYFAAGEGSGGYEDIALALMRALTGGGPARLILNVRNAGTLPHLPADAVVEVSCTADTDGARPRPVTPLDAGQAALTAAVKASERAVLEAAATGSAAAARRAFAIHPLVASDAVAGRLLAAYRRAFPELAYLR